MIDAGGDLEGLDMERDQFFFHGFLIAARQNKKERNAEFDKKVFYHELIASFEKLS